MPHTRGPLPHLEPISKKQKRVFTSKKPETQNNIFKIFLLQVFTIFTYFNYVEILTLYFFACGETALFTKGELEQFYITVVMVTQLHAFA